MDKLVENTEVTENLRSFQFGLTFPKHSPHSLCFEPCLRLVEDSDGLRPSLRGVQGVAAGVVNKVLVITQEDDAGTGLRLETQTSTKK